MSEPSMTAVKTLFAHSRNLCFYERCEAKLTDPRWKRVNARIAHIKGEHPGSARYDPTQSEEERQGYENIMLVCPDHHTLIDDLLPDEHPVERLQEMRAKHLSHQADGWQPPDEMQMAFAIMVIEDSGHRAPSIPGPDITLTAPPADIRLGAPPGDVSTGSDGSPGATVSKFIRDEASFEVAAGSVLPLEAKGTITFGGGASSVSPEAGAPDAG